MSARSRRKGARGELEVATLPLEDLDLLELRERA